MKAECAATWGAFCALQGRVIPAGDVDQNIFTDAHTPFEKEKILRTRYGDAIRKIEHFFSEQYRSLLYWIREEADIFNIELIAKNALVRRDDTFTDSLLLRPPAARFTPPESASIGDIADLIHCYHKSISVHALRKGIELYSRSSDFFLFESGCELGRIESLLKIASSFPYREQMRILHFAAPMITAWVERLPKISGINPNAADALSLTLRPCQKRIAKKTSCYSFHSSASEKDIYSPSWYFVQFMLIRGKMAQISSSFFQLERAL
jgi:hypothetical protein